MNSHLLRRITPVALLLVLSTLACLFNTKVPAAGTQNPSGGSGNQDLPDPSVGLDSFNAYQARLTIGFTGTQNGSSSQWTNIYTLAVEPSHGTRLISIASTGLPADSSLDGWLAGSYAGMLIERPGTDVPCRAQKIENGSAATGIELSDLLPPVTGAIDAGKQDLQGLTTQHFTFDLAALEFPGKGKVSGEMWLAENGGYLVRYSLSMDGGPDLFDQDMQGVMTWEYQLSDINGNLPIDLPEDCPPGLIEAPLMDGARIISDQPGLQEFEVASDVNGVLTFYQEKMTALGYTLQEEPMPNEAIGQLTFTKAGRVLIVLVEKGTDSSSHVLVTLQRSDTQSAGPTATPEATATADPAASLAERLGKALSLLIISGNTPSPLGSYHLELNESLPALDKQAGKVKVSSVQITADVEGTNYYLRHTEDQKVINDGYMIDDQEYDVKNGQISPGLGLLDVDWVSWQFDILMPYQIASLGPTPRGQENVDGRSTDVFALDSANANPAALSALQSISSFTNMNITASSGTVWLDQETGAVLKLILDYTGEIKDAQGTSVGTAQAHIDLSVTRVGAVTVKLP